MKTPQRPAPFESQRLQEILPEFRNRFKLVNNELLTRPQPDAAIGRNEQVCIALGIGRESIRKLLKGEDVTFHMLKQLQRENRVPELLKHQLLLDEVCDYISGRASENPYTRIDYFLQRVPLPPPEKYQEREDCAQQLQKFFMGETERVLNVFGEQGNGLTHFVAFQLQKFVRSGKVHSLFPRGIGYYNVNPANDQNYQTRRSVLANTVQTLMSLFKLPEDEVNHAVAIRRFFAGTRLLLIMENVPDEAYAENFMKWLEEADARSRIILISIRRLNLFDAGHLYLRPFNDKEALEFISGCAPCLVPKLSEVKEHTGFRPKHLTTFCSVATLAYERSPKDFLKLTIEEFADRLQKPFASHHLAGLHEKYYAWLPMLTVTRRPITPACAAAIWQIQPAEAERILRRLVEEAWLTRTHYSGGTYSFHFSNVSWPPVSCLTRRKKHARREYA